MAVLHGSVLSLRLDLFQVESVLWPSCIRWWWFQIHRETMPNCIFALSATGLRSRGLNCFHDPDRTNRPNSHEHDKSTGLEHFAHDAVPIRLDGC